MPGGCDTGTGVFLCDAARAHQGLLSRAAADTDGDKSPAGRMLAQIHSLVGQIPRRAVRDRFLLDPTFIEALHSAAGDSPSLAEWHHQIADPSVAGVWSAASFKNPNHLGNSLLALLLRDDSNWQGEVVLQTDLFGRLRFPTCDWSISLWSKDQGATPCFRNSRSPPQSLVMKCGCRLPVGRTTSSSSWATRNGCG